MYSLSLRRTQPHLHRLRRLLHTPPHARHVRPEMVKLTDASARFPALGTGLSYTHKIFNLYFPSTATLALQHHIWTRHSFLPATPAAALSNTPFALLSSLAARMPVQTCAGTPGLLAKNRLRTDVLSALRAAPTLHDDFIHLLRRFRDAPSLRDARTISDVAFWVQWLIRGWLFEGKLHGEQYTHPFVPAPLSTVAMAANAALGRLQVEFVYDDYTLKAAQFPQDWAEDSVDYNDPTSIVRYIEKISTPVGFNDVAGGMPEHNFRHSHSLMEMQMRRAFRGWRRMKVHAHKRPEKVVSGWADIATAAERAHRVFATMMTNTPPESYPVIRLPIKGVRGACGSVYPLHGVFYEGCGTDLPQADFAHCKPGCYVDREFGQTGANSSMFKWLDIFVGVSRLRSAYNLTDAQKIEMVGVIEGTADAGEMGENAIDSMQRAFDLLTRPAVHLRMLIDVEREVDQGRYLKLDETSAAGELWELAALQRLRLAYYVALHRCLHGKYVLKMIYGTQAVGGQSRATGTGGSTPNFLKVFFDQTIEPAFDLADVLLRRSLDSSSKLNEEMVAWIRSIRARLQDEERSMSLVQAKGFQLQSEESQLASAE